jgi:RNA-binding protein
MITKSQKYYLRSLAQTLPSKFQVGKGALTEEVLLMLEKAIDKQELIKIHILTSVHEEQDQLIEALVSGLRCELVQVIGHRVVLFRQQLTPQRRVIKLPA